MSYKIPTKVTEIRLSYQSKVKAADRPQIRSSQDAYSILIERWEQIELVEEFKILLLDRSNRVMAYYPVSRGGLAGTVVDAKMVFAAALKGRASSLILAHNHPSGSLQPSKNDIALTKKLKQAGEMLDIVVLDHLILTPYDGFYSFADEGMM